MDVETGKVSPGPQVPGGCSWMAWHPEGRLLAISSTHDRKIYLWDVAAGRRVLPPLEGHNNGGVVMCFNPAGDRLLSADWSDSWHLWDTQSGRSLLTLPGGNMAPCFRADGELLGTGAGGSVRLFRFRRGQELRTLVHRRSNEPGAYDSKGYSCLDAEGRLFAIGTDDGIAVVDVARGEEAALLPLPGNAPLRFDAEGALWTYGAHGLLRWPATVDVKTHERRYGPPRWVLGATNLGLHGSSSDLRVLAIPKMDGVGAAVFHRDGNRVLHLGPQEDVRSCAVSPDGRWAVTASHTVSRGAGVKIWDARDGRHVKDLPVGGVGNARFSPDGRWLLTSSGGCRLWAVGSWDEGPRLGGPRLNPAAAFSPDSKLLALGDAPGVVRLVATDTGAEIAKLTAPEQIRLAPCCFTPDGGRLIAVDVETSALHLFDLQAIRAGLAELDLDWDAPPLAHPRSADATPLAIRFELGEVRQIARAAELVRAAGLRVRAKNHAKALTALREAVKIAPRFAEAHNDLAWLLATGPAELRDPAHALVEARRAVELEPDRATFLNTLGAALYRNGKFAEAIPVLERSLRGQAGQADAFDLFFLAMCHHRLGDAAKAKDCRQRAERWFRTHKNRLPMSEWEEELTAFQTECDAVLAQPPGQAKK
jgi:WD40 repeat protein